MFYVILCHIRPDGREVAGEALVSVMERIKTEITFRGGLVRRMNNSGIRPLPNRMRSRIGGYYTSAHVATVEFVGNPKCAEEAVSICKGLDEVIRLDLLRSDKLLLNRPPRPQLNEVEVSKRKLRQEDRERKAFNQIFAQLLTDLKLSDFVSIRKVDFQKNGVIYPELDINTNFERKFAAPEIDLNEEDDMEDVAGGEATQRSVGKKSFRPRKA